MSPTPATLLVLAWILTYLVHSTVFLGGALALCGRSTRLPVRWQDRLWKLALVGGLLTATVQVGAGLEPFGGRVLLESDGTAAAAADVDGRGAAAPDPRPSAAFPVDGGGTPRERRTEAEGLRAVHGIASSLSPELAPAAAELDGEPQAADLPPISSAEPSRAAGGAPAAKSRAWIPFLGGAWILAALLGLLTFLRAQLRLRRHLAGRVTLANGPLRARLDVLLVRAGAGGRVRLTASPFVAAPLTHGLFVREICVPVRALTDLSPAQQEALLGHELGHALRRDPAWLGLCWLLERALLVQPLNRVARARLQHASELLCDDWAVHLTGRRLPLASCLTEVAQWVVGPAPALPAPGMASPGAPLTQRIERLLAAPPREVTRRERWWLAGGLAALFAVTLGAPGFALSLRDAPPARRAEPEPAPLPLPEPLSEPLAEPEADPVDDEVAGELPAEPPGTLQGLLKALDRELLAALEETRALKREAAASGAVERFADQLERIEETAQRLLESRAAIDSLLPRGLGTPEHAASAPPFPSETELPTRNEPR